MKHLRRSSSPLLRLFFGLVVTSASLGAAAIEVLFIGNSYTYGGGNPTTSYNHENVTDLHGTNYGGIAVVASATQIGGSTSWNDRLVDMNRAGILRFPHNGPTLNKESWDMDSLRVKVWAF